MLNLLLSQTREQIMWCRRALKSYAEGDLNESNFCFDVLRTCAQNLYLQLDWLIREDINLEYDFLILQTEQYLSYQTWNTNAGWENHWLFQSRTDKNASSKPF